MAHPTPQVTSIGPTAEARLKKRLASGMSHPAMNVKLLSDYRRTSPEKLLKHNLFQTDRFFLDVYCLKAGQAQSAHVHADADKVYIVFEGRCSFTVGHDTAEHGVGAAVHCPAGEPHGVLNPGPEDARLLVLMTPPPRKLQ